MRYLSSAMFRNVLTIVVFILFFSIFISPKHYLKKSSEKNLMFNCIKKIKTKTMSLGIALAECRTKINN